MFQPKLQLLIIRKRLTSFKSQFTRIPAIIMLVTNQLPPGRILRLFMYQWFIGITIQIDFLGELNAQVMLCAEVDAVQVRQGVILATLIDTIIAIFISQKMFLLVKIMQLHADGVLESMSKWEQSIFLLVKYSAFSFYLLFLIDTTNYFYLKIRRNLDSCYDNIYF